MGCEVRHEVCCAGPTVNPLRTLALGLVVVSAVACGARTSLKDDNDPLGDDGGARVDVPPRPDVPPGRDVPPGVDVPRVDVPPGVDRPPGVDVPETVTVRCPSSQRAVQTQTVTLAATATSSAGRPLMVRWTVEQAPAMVGPQPPNAPTTRLTLAASGNYRLRFTATDSLGRSDSCVAVVVADPAIDLLCPNDQSRYVSETASLEGRGLSRLGRTLRYTWEVAGRPPGSRGDVTPRTSTTPVARLPLDAVGDWSVRLTASDGAGLSAQCTTRVRVDPDVIVRCPPDVTSRPFSTVSLAGVGQSRLGRPLTYQWTMEQSPQTSTAVLEAANQATARFTFDVAGNWTWRLTARNDRGNQASCTTRALAASTEAIRVELVWNIDRSCRSCNPRGGGIDIDLHLADLSRSGGRWASMAPSNSDCYYANCRCREGVGSLCPNGALEWEPPGPPNNPQLDIDHISDLPGPENINLLQAAAGSTFAVGVHYFSGSEPTPAVVRVYCGGTLVFESEPVRMQGASGASSNPLWRVGDIEVGVGGRACVFRRCGRAGDLSGCIRGQNDW